MATFMIMLFLVRISVSVKRHYDHDNSYKGKHLIGVAYSFGGLLHYLQGGKQDSMQADVVLEKKKAESCTL